MKFSVRAIIVLITNQPQIAPRFLQGFENIFDHRPGSWDIPTMIAAMIDDKRRLTMPRELPPRSAVTIQRVDGDTWLVTRQKPATGIVIVGLPCLQNLPDDPEWEAIERRMVKHNNRKLPRFEE